MHCYHSPNERLCRQLGAIQRDYTVLHQTPLTYPSYTDTAGTGTNTPHDTNFDPAPFDIGRSLCPILYHQSSPYLLYVQMIYPQAT